jgi:hypothetical protein
MNQKIKDLHLLLLYLSSWEEDSRKDPGKKIIRAWKGHPFEILNEFDNEELITQHRQSKSIVFTEAGKRKAEEIKNRYF